MGAPIAAGTSTPPKKGRQVMAGRILYKEGVMGQLHPHVRKDFGRLAESYFPKGLDFIVTSIREGTHSARSLHPLGHAWDYDPQGVDLAHDKAVLGPDYDVVEERDHRHAEFDPKGPGQKIH